VNLKQRNRLTLKLIVYYAALVAFVVVLIRVYPGVIAWLPFGGLDRLQQGTSLNTSPNLVNLVTNVRVPVDMLSDGIKIMISMLGALLVMIPLRWVYLEVGDLEKAEHQPAGRKVSASLLLLPLVVTAIISIVKFSLALAFALTGIFAGVRYRTTLKNLTDALFIFACMAVGLAAGTQTLDIALALSVFFVFVALMLEPLVSGDHPGPLDEDHPPHEPPRSLD
jgi:hypothetical protein